MLWEMAVSPERLLTKNIMIILKYLTPTIKGYIDLYQNVPPDLEDVCPCCSGNLHKHGRYKRTVVTKAETFIIPIYRWFCPFCKLTISVLPDFLSPYKVFPLLLQETFWVRSFLHGKSDKALYKELSNKVIGGISHQTIRRWRRTWQRSHERFVQLLSRKILELQPRASPHKVIQQLHNTEQIISNLVQTLWKIIHPNFPYPFCGFFSWLFATFYQEF